MTKLPKIFWHISGGLARDVLRAAELGRTTLKAVELYHQGLRVKDIGRKIGYSSSGVRHVLRRAEDAGVEVRWRSPGRPRVDRQLVLGRVDLALDRGYGMEASAMYAAIMSGCSPSTVWRALRGD